MPAIIGETAARKVELLQADLLKANPEPDKATQQMAWVGEIQKFGFAEKSQL